MLERIERTITAQELIPDGSRILVAVSGGADSILLLQALTSLGRSHQWQLAVAHLNHGLRDAQSSRDAALVKAQAEALHVDCILESVDVRSLARRNGQSIEMAGRQARRDFFQRTARRLNIQRVATGHTADDRIETLLLNLARGTGVDALASIPYRVTLPDGVTLVRPLLDIERPAIEHWLEQQGHTWRDDPSNRNPVYRRNRVRHELLPWLESRLNPRVRQALQRLIQQAARDREWMESIAADAARKCIIQPMFEGRQDVRDPRPAIDRRRLASYPAALRQRVLTTWLHRLRIPPARIGHAAIERLDRMLRSDRPKKIVLAGSTRLQTDGNLMTYRPDEPRLIPVPEREWILPIHDGASLDLHELGLRITVTHEQGAFDRRGGKTPGCYPAEAILRMPASGEPAICIRCRRPGDRLRPTGSGGSRKIQDILIDAKTPKAQRQTIPLLLSGKSVVWLPGYRIADNWQVTDINATRLRIRIEGLSNH